MDKKVKNTPVEFETAEKTPKLEKFLAKYFKLLVCIVIAVVVALIVVAVVLNVSDNKKEANYLALDDLSRSYSSLQAMDVTSAEYTTALNAFYSDADALSAKAGKSYPAYKAEYLKASQMFVEEDYQGALKIFESLSVSTHNIYLGPLCMLNAAVCAENAGDVDKALSYYNKIWDDYGYDTAVSPKALFNTGRIYEAKGKTDLAKAAYQQLVDEFQNPEKGTDTEYARLALNRLQVL
jgi:hypothetical protein